MADHLFIISQIAFVLSAIFLVISIVLWFYYKIPMIVGYLTGSTAKKSMESVRENNAQAGQKALKVNMTTNKSRRLTEKISAEKATEKLDATEKLQQDTKSPGEMNRANEAQMGGTMLLERNMSNVSGLDNELAGETTLLSAGRADGVSSVSDATELLSAGDATELLSVGDATAPLGNRAVEMSDRKRAVNSKEQGIYILDEVMLIHTQEVI